MGRHSADKPVTLLSRQTKPAVIEAQKISSFLQQQSLASQLSLVATYTVGRNIDSGNQSRILLPSTDRPASDDDDDDDAHNAND
ncbi:hypothetical protein CH63R_05978 [Colletotrichum higginsianum IMI 349063]|uniref:Uncharacterized protein n=1 Tax=Colletotrichum higginsianum (strain IMI 349063) TaxID=759273 RepID=A0A1B7YDV2_COLHI|nr:hypothetical protein CH63R_05978 [Colletotrichum higginsianum IMI 349063]OBR10286.1 hypothetical protein CH63R_05978 [Colletotrichum higginsianum IMI 349063]